MIINQMKQKKIQIQYEKRHTHGEYAHKTSKYMVCVNLIRLNQIALRVTTIEHRERETNL